MKVLCIDVSNPKRPQLLLPEHQITEGEIYTVTGSYFDKSDGNEYYYLAERQMEPVCSYRASRFIPLITEDEEQEAEAVVYADNLC